eukprot:4842069-Prymnesium_polylepis.1
MALVAATDRPRAFEKMAQDTMACCALAASTAYARQRNPACRSTDSLFAADTDSLHAPERRQTDH